MANKERLLDKIALSPREVAKMAGMSHQTIYNLINARKLPAHKQGARTVVLREDLDRYLRTLPRHQGKEKVREIGVVRWKCPSISAFPQ